MGIVKKINPKATLFNKKAIADLTFKEFENIYKDRFPEKTDLNELFKKNGGKSNK